MPIAFFPPVRTFYEDQNIGFGAAREQCYLVAQGESLLANVFGLLFDLAVDFVVLRLQSQHELVQFIVRGIAFGREGKNLNAGKFQVRLYNSL